MRQWIKRRIEVGLRGFLRTDTPYRVLRAHFFRRFFDNDAISPYGDAATSAAQGMMLAAWPSLVIGLFTLAFLLRPLDLVVGNWTDYFFTTYSFVGMGLLAIFEWEMLFPDKRDFLILTPLPLDRGPMLSAKVESLVRFLGMFLLSMNALTMLIVPGVAGHNYLRAILAHTVSVLLAGSFSALLVLGVGGAMLCVLSAAAFRRLLPVAQMLIAALLVWMAPQVRLLGIAMDLGTRRPPDFVHWLPPFWFLSIYDRLLLGAAAPEHLRAMAATGMYVWLGTAAFAVAIYPLAWRKQQRLTVEGLSGSGLRGRQLLAIIAARRPEERAVFAFIGQTLRRNQHYQSYLTIYGGVGIAIAGLCVISVHLTHGKLGLEVMDGGLRAVMPLLLFWLIAGVRAAFDLPVDLAAAWVFATSGVELSRCAAAARRWAAMQGVALVCVAVVAFACIGWTPRQLLVQFVLGASLAVVMADLFFAFHRGIPFTRPRLPGKTNVAILVGLYAGVLPYFIVHVVSWQREMERDLSWLCMPVAIAIGLRLALWKKQSSEGLVYELHDEVLEGTLTLGLNQ